MSKPLKPFFSFFGGKWRAVPRHYPKPKHDIIIEPFAGSAGYSVRYPEKQVILGEKDPVIFGVWEYLIQTPAEEIRALPDIASGQSVNDLPICQEARWLIGFWLNKGTTRPGNVPSAWMRRGTHDNSYWGERIRGRIASQVDRIRHWRVVNCPYEDLPMGGWQATWFVDPPYQCRGKHYVCGSSGIDYQHLAEWCRARQGQVMVCENEGAEWLPFRFLADIKGSPGGQKQNHRSAEVIWIQES